jgi:RNA recognition motif-containing protein
MTNIYVGNLNFTTSEDQLRTLFSAYGAVETVRIVPIATPVSRADLHSSR